MKAFNGFQKGIDLGGWMSQCDYSKDRLDNFITEKDFERIAACGLDHVRLPFDFNIVQDADGRLLPDGFERIGKAIEYSRKNGLNIILDLHKTAGFSFDPGEKENGFFDSPVYQERFFTLWEEMARLFGHDPEHVAFELLNEVTDKAYSAAWNAIANACIARIRAIAPDVVILIGSYHNNHVQAVRDLGKPYDDKIVYNFHCYDPLFFTHQGAYWVQADGFDVNARQTFEQSGASVEYFEALFADAVAAAEENDTVLYCGEYGVIALADPRETLKWYQAIHTVFERHHIGRAAWSYREMDFDLFGSSMQPVFDELIKYL